jgi:type VI secretion system secreted protein Hcp
MAMDMFLKSAELPGESKGKGHIGEIDVLAWSWGTSNSGTMHTGGGGGAGKANVQDLSITKYIDKATPKLLLASLKGTHFPTMVLIAQKAGGDAQKYIEITLTNILITSLSTGGSGGEDRLTENVSLNFEKVKFEYFGQNEKGAVVTAGPAVWDISANASQ